MPRWVRRHRGRPRSTDNNDESPPPPYSEHTPGPRNIILWSIITGDDNASESGSRTAPPTANNKSGRKEKVKRQPPVDECVPLLALRTNHGRQYSWLDNSNSQTVDQYEREEIRRSFPRAAYRSGCCTLLVVTVGLLAIVLLLNRDLSTSPKVPLPTYTIGIIGAGPAGISAAKHLQEMKAVDQFQLNIKIFESSSSIGGRLAMSDSDHVRIFPFNDRLQDPISAEDIAGSSLVRENPFITTQYEKVLESQVRFDELPSSKVGYIDEEKLVSDSTRPYKETSWSSWAGQLLKYGRSVSWIQGIIDEGNLGEKVTTLSEVSNVHDILVKLGCVKLAQAGSSESLESHSISTQYRDEVVAPRIGRAFAQSLDEISSFALSTAHGKEDRDAKYTGSDLIDMLEEILPRSNVSVTTNSQVTSITQIQMAGPKLKWLMDINNTLSERPQLDTFDHVILAAPGLERNLLGSSELNELDLPGYRPIHVTFFTSSSRLDPAMFGSSELPEQVLFIQSPKLRRFRRVHEIAHVREVSRVRDDTEVVEHLYRCLSDEDITDQLLPSLSFEGDDREEDQKGEISWIYQKRIENAYPLVFPRNKFPSFKLSHDNLWSTSAIDTIGSTADLRWAAGRIVAKQIVETLCVIDRGQF